MNRPGFDQYHGFNITLVDMKMRRRMFPWGVVHHNAQAVKSADGRHDSLFAIKRLLHHLRRETAAANLDLDGGADGRGA